MPQQNRQLEAIMPARRSEYVRGPDRNFCVGASCKGDLYVIRVIHFIIMVGSMFVRSVCELKRVLQCQNK
jgi:hypothetical protein